VQKKHPLMKNETFHRDLSNLTSIYRGLCSTCKNAPECTYPRDPERPVMQCEEFEGVLKISEKPSRTTITFLEERDPKADEVLGLCKMCQRRATCTFPKHEGGVWHCEEYE
jgi:hypothetical protein